MTDDVRMRSLVDGRASDLELLEAREITSASQVSVRSRTPEALDLPATANTWTLRGDADALWLGPDEWLLVGTVETDGLAAADATVDVSANRVVLELTGSGRHELLAASCSLDLDARVWTPGRCAQTLVGRIPVLLQEREGATRVFVRPSYARAFVDWLVATAP